MPYLSCAYLGQYHLGQFQRDLESMLQAGISRVFLPMTEEDVLLRQSNLQAMAEAARGQAMEVWMIPWGVGGVFAEPRGTHFAARYLDARQIDSVGESLPAACPNQPRFAHFMETWLQAANDCGAHGIMLDEPVWLRHPSLPDYRGMETAHLWTCRCDACQRRFRSLYRAGEMPEDLDDDVRDFRARTMGSFLREIGESAWRRRMASALKISVHGALATWEMVARQSWCREVAIPAFWPQSHAVSSGEMEFGPSEEPDESSDLRMIDFRRQMEAGKGLLERLSAHTQPRITYWLRCFQVPKIEEPLIRQSIEALHELGADSLGIWSFGGTATVGEMACERPDEAWRQTLEAIAATYGLTS